MPSTTIFEQLFACVPPKCDGSKLDGPHFANTPQQDMDTEQRRIGITEKMNYEAQKNGIGSIDYFEDHRVNKPLTRRRLSFGHATGAAFLILVISSILDGNPQDCGDSDHGSTERQECALSPTRVFTLFSHTPDMYTCYGAIHSTECDHSLDVAGTVCCATLPTHIQYSVHDVGSTFKRLLSVLPGGILGSLSLFDAFVGIHSQLHGEPEFPRTKQTKVRARLIALAIGTIESQFRREIICAVFGLLSLIGRVAEMSPREDADGRPLPTGDLIGYNALGIVFGPLLVGDLLDKYTMKLATPTSGLLLFPLSPRRQRRDKQKHKSEGTEPPHVDKVMVAINIAEMLITNWRDMVRQMKALGTHHRHESSSMRLHHRHRHPSISESFAIKMPRELKETRPRNHGDPYDREHSPEPETPTMALKRRRSRPMKRATSVNRFQNNPHLHQNTEEGMEDQEPYQPKVNCNHKQVLFAKGKGKSAAQGDGVLAGSPPITPVDYVDYAQNGEIVNDFGHAQGKLQEQNHAHPDIQPPNVAPSRVPPRMSSKQGLVGNRSATSSTIISSSEDGFTKLPPDGEVLYQTPEQNERDEQTIDPSFLTSRTTVQFPTPEKRLENPTGLGNSTDSALSPELYMPQQERNRVDEYKGLNLASLASLNLSVATGDFQELPFAKSERELVGTRSAPTLIHTPGKAIGEESFYNHTQTTYQSHHNNARDFKRGRDTSESDSARSSESEMPMKRRSVKAMAAMFESQQFLQHMTQSHRQPPAGGVHLTPLGQHARDFLERSNSLPLWAPRDVDKSDWVGNEEHDLEKLSPIFLQTNFPLSTGFQDENNFEHINTCTTTCTRNKCNLKSQIENLERLLNNKMAEVDKLRRQLEKRAGGGGGSPGEQLRQAKKDISIWKEKAEVAERKMKVFEKFTTKVRGIRDSMMAESSRHSSMNQGAEWTNGPEPMHGEQAASPQQMQRVRFAEMLKMVSEISASDDSGTMGDEMAVPAKIRNCLHRNADKQEAPMVLKDIFGTDGAMSPRDEKHHDSGLGVVQIWSAVEELLQMGDDEMFRGNWSPMTKKSPVKVEDGPTVMEMQ
ncbi:hypothetical protein PT974_07452 [Cladobotryum mycophilum]|uniref:Uncharacterized protein n=1 Tax=Cladobotryum mycophilum TaxID=491253 RepID=A0ABR0SPD3_9HYPO